MLCHHHFLTVLSFLHFLFSARLLRNHKKKQKIVDIFYFCFVLFCFFLGNDVIVRQPCLYIFFFGFSSMFYDGPLFFFFGFVVSRISSINSVIAILTCFSGSFFFIFGFFIDQRLFVGYKQKINSQKTFIQKTNKSRATISRRYTVRNN